MKEYIPRAIVMRFPARFPTHQETVGTSLKPPGSLVLLYKWSLAKMDFCFMKDKKQKKCAMYR